MDSIFIINASFVLFPAKPLNDCLSAPTQCYLVSSINRTMAECAGDVPPAGELLRLHVLFLT